MKPSLLNTRIASRKGGRLIPSRSVRRSSWSRSPGAYSLAKIMLRSESVASSTRLGARSADDSSGNDIYFLQPHPVYGSSVFLNCQYFGWST